MVVAGPAGMLPRPDRATGTLVLRYRLEPACGGSKLARPSCSVAVGPVELPAAGAGWATLELRLQPAAMASPGDCAVMAEGDAWAREPVVLQGSANLAAVASDIVTCQVLPALRRPYLAAKGVELACLTLDAILRRHEKLVEPAPARRADLAKTELAREILLQELEKPPRLERLARRVGLNRSKLAACFKYLYGCGVYEFSRRERLQAASRMLTDTEASIMQIAAATGYVTLASFSKSFSAEFGASPRAWRGSGARTRQEH